MTLLEIIVALLVLSVTAAALLGALLASQRAMRSSERLVRALLAGADHLESSRLDPVGGTFEHDGMNATLRIAPAELAGLLKAEVAMEWNDGEPRSLDLATLFWRGHGEETP